MYTRETAEKHIVDKVTFYSMVLIIFCMVSFFSSPLPISIF